MDFGGLGAGVTEINARACGRAASREAALLSGGRAGAWQEAVVGIGRFVKRSSMRVNSTSPKDSRTRLRLVRAGRYGEASAISGA